MEPPPALQGSDEQHLLRAVQLAQKARDLGEAPFGSLLVNRVSVILMETHNTVLSTRDISAHPEFKIAQWVAREMSRSAAAETSMFTSCQPCAMCSDAIDRSGIGRVIYALSGEQLHLLRGTAGYVKVPQHGPYMPEVAANPVRDYYNSK
jgi:tRNA(Arg) A34 adenosine deaminase TadA